MSNRNAVHPNPKQLDTTATVPRIPTKIPDDPPLQAARGNDEVMSQPPESRTSPRPSADQLQKRVAHETAQENVHEVMSKTAAKKLAPESAQKAPPEKSPWKSRPGK